MIDLHVHAILKEKKYILSSKYILNNYTLNNAGLFEPKFG